MRKKQVIVYISGGLGNQLFQLGAAKYISDRGWDVFVDPIRNDINGVRNTQIIELTEAFRIGYITRKPLILKALKIWPLRSMYFCFLKIKSQDEPQEFCTPSLSYKFKNKNRIFGYWQTIVTANLIVEKILKLKNLEPNSDSIAVHIRRGDYLDTKHQTHGILDGSYFLDAVEVLREISGVRKIVIFTDSPELVKSEKWIRKWAHYDYEFSNSTEPWETLIEMAKFQYIVCSNSTFSWWAAHLGYDKKIVLPRMWFVNREIPESLVIPGALILDSNFMKVDQI